jgi:hypothetical protein
VPNSAIQRTNSGASSGRARPPGTQIWSVAQRPLTKGIPSAPLTRLLPANRRPLQQVVRRPSIRKHPLEKIMKDTPDSQLRQQLDAESKARFPSRVPLALSNASLTTTTPCGCIRPSAMLPRLIGSPAATSRSSSSAIANSNSLAKTEKLNDNP